METSFKTFSNASVTGWNNVTLANLYGLPTIPKNAALKDVILTCSVSRDGKGPTVANGAIHFNIDGRDNVYDAADPGRNKTTNIKFSILSKVDVNDEGVLSYSNGATYIEVEVYHRNVPLVGTSTWSLSNAKITAYYTPKYTIKVSAGTGGSVSTTGGTYDADTTFSVSATASTGYTFAGWANQSGTITTTVNPYSFTVNNNTTFSAVFTPITYYVAYSANGGSGTMATDSVSYGADYTLKSSTFTAPTVKMILLGAGDTEETKSKVFAHWEGSNGIGYLAGQTVSNILNTSDTITMKAIWSGATFTLPAVADTTSQKFLGWYFDRNIYEPGYTFTTDTDIQFVAVWEDKKLENVYGGNTQATIYVGNDECVAVYVGNTKIYG